MKKRINISLDEEIATQLKYIAKKSKRNVSQWITDQVIESYSTVVDHCEKRDENE